MTILIPCLNEEETILKAVRLAQKALKENKLLSRSEILVADNGSSDNSVKKFANKPLPD